jgi:hypothetical protein
MYSFRDPLSLNWQILGKKAIDLYMPFFVTSMTFYSFSTISANMSWQKATWANWAIGGPRKIIPKRPGWRPPLKCRDSGARRLGRKRVLGWQRFLKAIKGRNTGPGW